jgi:hypothetical protein
VGAAGKCVRGCAGGSGGNQVGVIIEVGLSSGCRGHTGGEDLRVDVLYAKWLSSSYLSSSTSGQEHFCRKVSDEGTVRLPAQGDPQASIGYLLLLLRTVRGYSGRRSRWGVHFRL